ncbi:MAG: formyl-CoA transferase [Desulfovibrio sp.]|nr:formyl-CoA transferase [Desulfovibrio sp.]
MSTAPLQGIKVVDFTNVQSGPSCTQLLAWLGAEVIKIEEPGRGDPTRKELQFNPDCPSYYFLQLNSDKKSLSLDAARPDGKEILTRLLKNADIFIENLHPGAMDKLGFSWDVVHKLNPRCIYGSIKGFPVSSKYAHLKAYEPIAQVTGGAATTTGWWSGEHDGPTQSGAALGDSNTGMHMCIGLLAALALRDRTGEGTFVYQSMHNACLNLCRIKTRDQLTLDKIGYLTQYPQYPNEKFPDYVPRDGNIEGGGVLGWCYPCKGYPEDPNDFVYVILQRDHKSFELFCKGIGFEDWLENPDFNTADARDRHKQEIYRRVGEYCRTRSKFEVTGQLSQFGVPVAPVLNTREILTDETLYDGNTLVKINQPGYNDLVGEFVTVGVPFTISGYQPTYGPCPTLGGNNEEVLTSLGFTKQQQEEFAKNGTTHPLPDGKM